jgi:hypothetical protein
MPKSTDLLVVNPYLTTVLFAQRITQAQYTSLVSDQQLQNTPFKVAPYSQTLQRKLRANFNNFYNNYFPNDRDLDLASL